MEIKGFFSCVDVLVLIFIFLEFNLFMLDLTQFKRIWGLCDCLNHDHRGIYYHHITIVTSSKRETRRLNNHVPANCFILAFIRGLDVIGFQQGDYGFG
ncbi:hypothetical protein Hanom_Chr01g00023661 [Helianthus anomalus]